jgi:hypothetical protein
VIVTLIVWINGQTDKRIIGHLNKLTVIQLLYNIFIDLYSINRTDILFTVYPVARLSVLPLFLGI